MSKETENTTRGAFTIGVEQHEKFEHISDTKFVSSTDFCGLVSQMFGIYADFEGCSYEAIPGTNTNMIALFFNHKLVGANEDTIANIVDDGRALAITRDSDGTAKNSTLRDARNLTSRYMNGDKFFLTDDGKSGLRPFLMEGYRSIMSGNGEINWGKVTQEVSETNYNMPQQYTKVSFIDPAKVAEAIYGKVDEDGTKWVYGVRVLRSIPTISTGMGTVSSNYMLAIERVCEEEVYKLAQQCGVGVSSGLNIIR